MDKQVKCSRETKVNALNSGFVFNIEVKYKIGPLMPYIHDPWEEC